MGLDVPEETKRKRQRPRYESIEMTLCPLFNSRLGGAISLSSILERTANNGYTVGKTTRKIVMRLSNG